MDENTKPPVADDQSVSQAPAVDPAGAPAPAAPAPMPEMPVADPAPAVDPAPVADSAPVADAPADPVTGAM